eukprot:TRINITY_DN4073_c0_g1_i2.p1 TRINITY_DN4073_c0_g1~~TRINITY_DN4073_c0_g1_i2.p1  ORF type:complete len:126 (+),score=18.66 TRINITY_DN4073_c0_g1_i2:34-378(+)
MASRLSKRQGLAAVFSGPVGRWRKTWSPVASTSASLSSSRLELYRWMPQESRDDNPEDASAHPVKFLPLSVVLERRTEVSKSASAVVPRPKKDEQEGAEQIEETQAVDGWLLGP